MAEEMFNSIKNGFLEIANRIENVNLIIEKIGSSVDNSMAQLSTQIEDLTNTLEDLMKLSDLKKVKQTMGQMVDTFRTQLNPEKIQKLINEITEAVKQLKQKH